MPVEKPREGPKPLGEAQKPTPFHERMRERYGEWRDRRIGVASRRQLTYQRFSDWARGKGMEWKAAGGFRHAAASVAEFMLVPNERVRTAAVRMLTPEGHEERRSFLDSKLASFIKERGESGGTDAYRKWLRKERLVVGALAAAEAGVWALTLSPFTLLPHSIFGSMAASRAVERGGERVVEGGMGRVMADGADRVLERALEKGTEHMTLDMGKHAAEGASESPVLSKFKTLLRRK